MQSNPGPPEFGNINVQVGGQPAWMARDFFCESRISDRYGGRSRAAIQASAR